MTCSADKIPLSEQAAAVERAAVIACLDYNQETGRFIWKMRKDTRPEWNTRHAGKSAGCLRNDGYLSISIFNRRYLAHRLAWFIVYGFWPAAFIDHKNQNKSDNRISNLRIATDTQNKANSKKPKRNTSGFKGVGYLAHTQKWRARIKRYGTEVSLGHYDTAEEAHRAYREAAVAIHGEFARW